MKFSRNEFMTSAAAFAVSPMLAEDGRKVKTPLMLVNATREKMEARLAIPKGAALRSRVFGRGEARQPGDGCLDVSLAPLDVLVVSLVR